MDGGEVPSLPQPEEVGDRHGVAPKPFRLKPPQPLSADVAGVPQGPGEGAAAKDDMDAAISAAIAEMRK